MNINECKGVFPFACENWFAYFASTWPAHGFNTSTNTIKIDIFLLFSLYVETIIAVLRVWKLLYDIEGDEVFPTPHDTMT